MAPKRQKGSKITLASVLVRTDQECLLSELKSLLTEAQVSVCNKAEIQAVCGHLENVVTDSEAKGWTSITLQLLIHLLKVLPADLTEQLARVLLDSAILKLMGQAFDKLNRSFQEGASNKQLEHATMVLLQTVEDLSACHYKGPGKQGMVHGKDRCGAVFVKRLVSLAASSVAGVIQRRKCVQLLLELSTRSQSNRELLFSYEEGCKQLFGQVVASCGDYSTQADAMEILYRAAKQDTLRDGGITFQGQPKVKAIFEALVNKSVQDVDASGLTNEIRQLVKAYNASQGSSASVHSFKAAEVSIGGSQDIRAVDGKWVDVGKQHLSLAVVVPDIDPDSEEPPPDLLDIFYSNISSVDATALPGNDSRHVQLKLCLKETPDILLDHFDAFDKCQCLSFTFKKDDLDVLLAVIKKVAPNLVKPPAGKPVNDSQDSFFELTQRPQPRVKMSMTMQTLSFRPSTSGPPSTVRKGSLDLQPSSAKARPSSATVQQQRPASTQDHTAAPIAPQNASGGRQHPAVHGSSLLQSKDIKTVAAARSHEVAHGSARHALEGVNDDTAGSPELAQQDERAGYDQEGSQGSGSSSDPSEEVLDDPTNIALSQRAPAHLQHGQVLPPHGDPLLAAARPVEKLPASVDEELPVKSLPGQQGQWKTKRGAGQSTLPHQTGSASTRQPEKIQHSIPAQSSRPNVRQPQAQSQPEQHNGPAQSSRAACQQPQALARSQARSSPLYAESEGEDSETESSNGGSEAAREAEQPQQQQQPEVEPRQTRASGRASRAASKPPTGRAKGRAGPSAPLRKKNSQEPPKGSRQIAPSDDEEDVEGFGLFSQDQQEPVRQSKHSRVKPHGKVQEQSHVTKDQSHVAKPARQGSASANPPSHPHRPHQRALPSPAPSAQPGGSALGQQVTDSAATARQQQLHDQPPDSEPMPNEQRAALKAAPRGPGQQATAAPALQAAALEKAAARRDSGNDSEWMAIGQQVSAGRQVQAGTEDAAARAPVLSREDEQDNGEQAKPEQPKQRQNTLFPQAASGDESWPARVPVTAEHAPVPAEPAENPAKQQQAAAPKQQQPAKGQGQQAQRARQITSHKGGTEVEDADVPATYNNMPLKHKQSSQQVRDDDDASDEEADAHEVRQAAGQQQKKKRGHQKQQPAQVVGKDLDFAASDAESDEYEPTQAKAAAKAAAKKAAAKATQPKGAKGRPRQPKKKQQGNSKQPHNAAKTTAQEGPAKRPRGKPRKAPQAQQLRQQASKRKAAEVTYEEEEGSDEEMLPIKDAVKPKAKQSGQLKRTALISEENDDAPFQAEEEVEIEEDAMLEDAPAPPARQQPPFRFMGKTYRGQSNVPYRAAYQMAAPDQQTEGGTGNEAEDDNVSFAPVFEEEEHGTPAMFVPVVKGGAQQTGQKRVHVNNVLFMAPMQAPSADTTGDTEDIEVDLRLQQGLIQSTRPSPAKVHTKGNALRDISNWKLPTPAKKQGPVKGRPATPLEALTGKAGMKDPAGDTFEVYQDGIKGRKQAGARAQGITGAQQAGHAKPGQPRAGRGKAAKAQPALAEPSDSEEEEGAAAGPSIKGVLQHMVQGMTSQDVDSDEEGSELADLQRVLQKVVSSKKANARQKQAGIIQGVQDQIDALAVDLKKCMKKDLHDSGALCQAQFADLCNQLADKKAQITTKTETYQKEVQGLWEGYKETYAMLEPMRQHLAVYMQDQSAGHKRKLAELQSEGERLMADADRKLAKTQSKAAKLPALAKMLKAFV
ncbi:hypothetical protein WJX77_010833 [Trebouxia sp. C0004]